LGRTSDCSLGNKINYLVEQKNNEKSTRKQIIVCAVCLSVCLSVCHLEHSPSPSVHKQLEPLFVPSIVAHEGSYEAILLNVPPTTGQDKIGQDRVRDILNEKEEM
jgi:hypothetical protein